MGPDKGSGFLALVWLTHTGNLTDVGSAAAWRRPAGGEALACLLAAEQAAMQGQPGGLWCCCSCHCCFFCCCYSFVCTAADAVVKESEAEGHILLRPEIPILIWLLDWFESNRSMQLALWAASRTGRAKLLHRQYHEPVLLQNVQSLMHLKFSPFCMVAPRVIV